MGSAPPWAGVTPAPSDKKSRNVEAAISLSHSVGVAGFTSPHFGGFLCHPARSEGSRAQARPLLSYLAPVRMSRSAPPITRLARLVAGEVAPSGAGEGELCTGEAAGRIAAGR
jgi:hypothetical protein